MGVEFYCSATGTDYVGDYILGLPAKIQKKIERELELIEKYGFNFLTHSGYAKKLHGYDMYEIIVNFGSLCYRIFCVIRNTTVWLLHIFLKKTNGTPIREINTALSRSKELNLALNVN